MSRIVLIIDSDTGKFIDVTGRTKESGRYLKFAKRLLSADKNPTLDYGGNGGDSLTISKGGKKGKAINILADNVNVAGNLTVAGKQISELVKENPTEALDYIVGTPDEILVTSTDLNRNGEITKGIKISFAQNISDKLSAVDASLDSISNIATRDDIASLTSGLSIEDNDTLDDVKKTLNTLLARISELAK